MLRSKTLYIFIAIVTIVIGGLTALIALKIDLPFSSKEDYETPSRRTTNNLNENLPGVTYKSFNVPYGIAFVPEAFSSLTYTAKINSIEKTKKDELSLELDSLSQTINFVYDPEQTMTTIGSQPDQNQYVWRIFTAEEILDEIEAGDELTFILSDLNGSSLHTPSQFSGELNDYEFKIIYHNYEN